MNGKARLAQLPGFKEWAYDIHEATPGIEQVNLYRDSVLRFTTAATLPHEKMIPVLINTAAQMEFDIQRRFSQRLYGFDAVRTEAGIFADMTDANIRKFLARYAVPLKQIEVSDCGILWTDVSDFLEVLEEEKKQLLTVDSYTGNPERTVIVPREKWRIDDMCTPTLLSFRRNLTSVRRWILTQRTDCECPLIYSFVINSRDVLTETNEKQ